MEHSDMSKAKKKSGITAFQFLRGPADGMWVTEADHEADTIEILTERGIYRYERTPEGDYIWNGIVVVKNEYKAPHGQGEAGRISMG